MAHRLNFDLICLPLTPPLATASNFEVLEDIKVKDVIVVPRGGLALATVTKAQHKRRMARAGKLYVNIDDVRLVDGEKAPLRRIESPED